MCSLPVKSRRPRAGVHLFAPVAGMVCRKRREHRRQMILAGVSLLLTAVSLKAEASTAYGRQHHPSYLTVATPGGVIAQEEKTALWDPYRHQEAVVVSVDKWDGTLAAFHRQFEEIANPKKHVDFRRWSLLMAEGGLVRFACAQGLLQIDMSSTTPGTQPVCGLPAMSVDIVLTWDSSRLESEPGWAGFWDVARHPGKRGLRRDPRTTLEIALLSDGVPPEDIYNVLGTPEGLDRAFRRLNQIRPYIVWWNTGTEAAAVMKSGAALMTSAPAPEIVSLSSGGANPGRFALSPALHLRTKWEWAVPMSAASPIKAQALMSWLKTAPQTQTFMQKYQVSDERARVLNVNDDFWAKHLTDISARFNQWLARP